MSIALQNERPEAPLFSDGLGERIITTDPVTGDLLQVLRVRPELTAVPSFEFALRERVARLANFRHAYYGRVRRVDRSITPPALAVVSDHVEGTRLSELLRVTQEKRLQLDINAAMCLIRQLVPAVALLHENARDVTHGLIAPERIVVTPQARLVIVEHVLGAAVEQLQFGRERLWQEFRIAMPVTAGLPRFDHRADMAAMGHVALALVLGRPLAADEYPQRIPALLNEPALSPSLRAWLSRAMQLEVRRGFGSAAEALNALEDVLSEDGGFVAAPVALETFMSRYIASLLEPPPPPQSAPVPVIYSESGAVPSAPPAPAFPEELTAAFRDELSQFREELSEFGQEPAASREEPPAPAFRAETPAPPAFRPSSPAASAFRWDAPAPPVTPAEPRSAPALRPEAPPPAAAPVAQPPASVLATPPPAAKIEPIASPEPPRLDALLDLKDLATDTGEASDGTNYDARGYPSFGADLQEADASSGTMKRLLIAAAVLVVLGGAGFAGLKFYGGRRVAAPTLGTLIVQSNPPGVPVFVDGVERGVTPARLSLAAGAHILELRRGVPRVIPLNITAGSEVSQYLEFAEVPVVGHLAVQSDPAGARVIVDGKERGVTPITISDLGAGEHEVVLRTDTATARHVVAIQAGGTASLVVPLGGGAASGPVSGWISVSAPFTLEIREGGRLIGTSDTERVMLTAGRHELDLINDTLGFRVTRVVQVPPGKVATLPLEVPHGVVNLNATPWAEVWIDGERAGETPLGNLSVPIGPHEVVFRHPQLGEKRHAISVVLGTPVRLSVDMR